MNYAQIQIFQLEFDVQFLSPFTLYSNIDWTPPTQFFDNTPLKFSFHIQVIGGWQSQKNPKKTKKNQCQF
jgi:hypothetical protein